MSPTLKRSYCDFYILRHISRLNKTGLQPVSRPVEQSFGFFRKVPKKKVKKRCKCESFRGGGVGEDGGDQNRRTVFEISVIRPVFHR